MKIRNAKKKGQKDHFQLILPTSPSRRKRKQRERIINSNRKIKNKAYFFSSRRKQAGSGICMGTSHPI